MTENRITSLRQLAQDIPPSRDLWQSIEREISGGEVQVKSARRTAWIPLFALAATLAVVGVGLWIGQPPEKGARSIVYTGFVTDPRYLRDRAALLESLRQRLNALPPESQQQVAASIATLQKAKRDLEDALGKDPGNALLQELLVNTYQDEMRVLTAVQQADSPGGGI